MIWYLTKEEVLFFNCMIIEEHGGEEQAGVKDEGLLESALARPRQTIFGEDAYPTLFLKAAALLESIAKNHAFHNANKRTSFLATTVFLEMNGYSLEMEQQFAEDFMVGVVVGDDSIEKIAEILGQHSLAL